MGTAFRGLCRRHRPAGQGGRGACGFKLGAGPAHQRVVVFAWGIALALSRPGAGLAAEIRGLDRRTVLFLTLSGLATGLSWLCYFRALQLGPASRVAPLDKLSVPLVMLLAWLFLGEKLTLRRLPAACLLPPGPSSWRSDEHAVRQMQTPGVARMNRCNSQPSSQEAYPRTIPCNHQLLRHFHPWYSLPCALLSMQENPHDGVVGASPFAVSMMSMRRARRPEPPRVRCPAPRTSSPACRSGRRARCRRRSPPAPISCEVWGLVA